MKGYSKHHSITKKLRQLLAFVTLGKYSVLIFIGLFVANLLLIHSIRVYIRSQSCLSRDQINSDSRCLYILGNRVFNKGSRAEPHQGHACGSDVSALIPSTHQLVPTHYLDPNYVGDVCADAPASPSPSPDPSPDPTPQSNPSPSPQENNPSPTPAAGDPSPTPQPSPSSGTGGTVLQSPLPSSTTKKSSPSPTATMSETTQSSAPPATPQSGFAMILNPNQQQTTQPPKNPTQTSPPIAVQSKPPIAFVWFSQALVYASFIVTLVTLLIGVIRFFVIKKKT